MAEREVEQQVMRLMQELRDQHHERTGHTVWVTFDIPEPHSRLCDTGCDIQGVLPQCPVICQRLRWEHIDERLAGDG